MGTFGRFAGVTIDCQDPRRLADFWSAVLGGGVTESLPGWRRVTVDDGTPVLTFQPVPEPKVGKIRLHLDIAVDDVGEAVDLIVALGGRWTSERHDYPEGAVLVMADPEDNEFCIVEYYKT
ncbi:MULTISPECIES: VOC family protein [Catenuloplanes]|uniref:Enzyme related to lactoylglutathione lyase n=1 Tax=Catenuloplanes niger TaxID=587534 RepID=A0AAE3ZLC3_9ACTN|nr:VOC family protein [Catenuloplanes niger]MDR7320735.1 putative enzyme related to lactoylglutathione lyase [Catenuloplanes niger]